jgi:FkbH-like protein
MMSALSWLPPPGDFRQRLKCAQALDDPGSRLEALAALAQTRLGFLETIQLDKALATASGSAPAGFTKLRVALLASGTVDHLLPGIRVAGLRRRLLFELYIGSFAQYRQELLDPASGLHRFRSQFITLSLGCRELIATVPIDATAAQARGAIEAAIEELRALWRAARSGSDAVVIQQSWLDVTEPLFGSFDRQVPGSPTRLVQGLNDALAQAAAADGALLLDIARYGAREGIDAWYDAPRWLQGKIEIAPAAAPLFGELLARLIGAQRGLSRKCLVLDLDNTLWGGVVGDVGVEGIELGAGTALGEAHQALQAYAKSLKDRGVMLAVCSKNDPSIALEAFQSHPEMLLRRADLTVFMANWTDKAENLRAIAAELNIGLDSLVFVDDNPAERARVREDLPMVAVPELPEDPAHYVRCIAEAGYFEAVAFTDEDRQRVGQYAANVEREALRESYQNMEDYLRGLEMSVHYGPVAAVDLARATQLINKTNQFNTTTQRLGAEELAALAGSPESLVLQFRLLDRFGDNGLVSVLIARRDRQVPGALEIANWVMSCRVFGRQLEDEAMNILVEMARARGAQSLRGAIIATRKNGVIAELYRNLGFEPEPGESEPGTTRWHLALAAYRHRPTHIQRRPTS